MDDFLIKFFPEVHERKLHAKEDNYCKYDNQFLQLFTSSLYLAALVSSFGASKVCTKFGRKPTILFASFFFLAGSALSAGAMNLWMLIIARILLGFGVGFGNEVNTTSQPFSFLLFISHFKREFSLFWIQFCRQFLYSYQKSPRSSIAEL